MMYYFVFGNFSSFFQFFRESAVLIKFFIHRDGRNKYCNPELSIEISLLLSSSSSSQNNEDR